MRLRSLVPTGAPINPLWDHHIVRMLSYQDPYGNVHQSPGTEPFFTSGLRFQPGESGQQTQERLIRERAEAKARRDAYNRWAATYVETMRDTTVYGTPGTFLFTVHFDDPIKRYPWNQRLTIGNEVLDSRLTLPGVLYILASDSREKGVMCVPRNEDNLIWDLSFTDPWISDGRVTVQARQIQVGHERIFGPY